MGGNIASFSGGFVASDGMLKKLGAVRKLALSHLACGVVAGAEVSSVLEEHAGFLVQMNKRFKTEIAYFKHMVDIGCLERLKSEVKACLPREAGMSASDAATRLSGVAAGSLFKWCGLGGQSLSLSALEVVRALAQNKAPTFGDANDPFLARMPGDVQVLHHIHRRCRGRRGIVRGLGGEGGGGEVCRGGRCKACGGLVVGVLGRRARHRLRLVAGRRHEDDLGQHHQVRHLTLS